MKIDRCNVSRFADEFHPSDLHRFKTDDLWVEDFIINNEGNIKNSFKQCMETLEWRKKFGANGELQVIANL